MTHEVPLGGERSKLRHRIKNLLDALTLKTNGKDQAREAYTPTEDPGYRAASVISFDGGAPNKPLLPEALFDRTREATVRSFTSTMGDLAVLAETGQLDQAARALFAGWEEDWETREQRELDAELQQT